MIGILCENSKKNTYSKKLYNLINTNFNCKIESIIVFSLSDLDLSNNTVSGNLITQNEIKSLTMPIPCIINNFREEKGRKKIRLLAEHTDVILINEVNCFKQHMIMEMLSSSAKTKDFVPVYSIYNSSSDINEVLQNSEAFILPEEGDDCKTFYTINDIMKNQSCLLPKKKWLVIDIPNTLMKNGNPTVFTLYAIRGDKNKWNVLPFYKSTLESGEDNGLIQILYESALEVASCIGSFIPLLAFCTVNFVLDENHSPFLANFAGWDSSLLLKKQNPVLLSQFAGYFFGYNNSLLNSKREKNHVD